MKGYIVGKILETEPVPKSKLTKTLTDIGSEEVVVLTTEQVEVGQKVVVITVGTTIEMNGDKITIAPRTMKGIESHGMFYGEEGLGLTTPLKGEIGTEYSFVNEVLC